MRIVGGRFNGRPLVAPRGAATRPTSDKVRESIFNILEHGDCLRRRMQGARVLDLFAGTGALGLEALSRGAAYVLFIDTGAAARAALRKNVEALDATGCTKIFNRDASRPGPMPTGAHGPFDLVFLDPPYREGLAQKALDALGAGGWLAPDACLAVEGARGDAEPKVDRYRLCTTRTYGDTVIWFLISQAD